MATYMIQAAYTAEAWAAMAKNPNDRRPGIRKLAESLGGGLKEMYVTLGEYDVLVIVEAPDDTAATALAIAAVSAGHLKTTKTTKLLSVEEGLDAMRRAGTLSYSAPKA